MKHLKRILALALFMGATAFGYGQSTALTIHNESECEVVISRVYVIDCVLGTDQFIYPNICIPPGGSASIPPVSSASHEWGEVVVCISEGCKPCQDLTACIDQPSSFVSCASPTGPYTITGCECSATVEFATPTDFVIY